MKKFTCQPGKPAAGALSVLSVVLLLAVPSAQAVPINIGGSQGVEGLGSFTGTFDYSFGAGVGTVTIVLNNTGIDDPGGFITAFVFNIPNEASVTGASLSSTNSAFGILDGSGNGGCGKNLPLFQNGVNGSPYGCFDIGASIGDGFEGGGSPNAGIYLGESATFTFLLTGTGLDGLTAQNFLDTVSVGPGDGEGNEELVVRFRGFECAGCEGSDKVPNDVVPEPGSLMLVGLGLAGLLAGRLSRRRA